MKKIIIAFALIFITIDAYGLITYIEPSTPENIYIKSDDSNHILIIINTRIGESIIGESKDAGKTFQKADEKEIPPSFINGGEVEGVCYKIVFFDMPRKYQLQRSTDSGKTWEKIGGLTEYLVLVNKQVYEKVEKEYLAKYAPLLPNRSPYWMVTYLFLSFIYIGMVFILLWKKGWHTVLPSIIKSLIVLFVIGFSLTFSSAVGSMLRETRGYPTPTLGIILNIASHPGWLIFAYLPFVLFLPSTPDVTFGRLETLTLRQELLYSSWQTICAVLSFILLCLFTFFPCMHLI